jgi:uncharacterized protein (TIGR02466 family)
MTENNFEIIPIFPEAVIFLKKLNVDNNKVIEYLKNLQFVPNKKGDNRDVFISKNLHIFDNNLNFLKEEINKHIHFYINEIFHYKMNYKFTTSWATKTKFNGQGEKHKHGNSFLSGVYYPLGNEKTKITFFKSCNNFWFILCKQYNQFNSQKITFSIIENNTLILFPSDLTHLIECNENQDLRYSIAFNINPKGEIGEDDSCIEF